jgi:hypothetical protein
MATSSNLVMLLCQPVLCMAWHPPTVSWDVLDLVDGVRRGPGGRYKNFNPKVVAKVALLSLLAGERDIVDMFSHASRIPATTRTNRPPFLLHGRELKESVMRTFSQHDF